MTQAQKRQLAKTMSSELNSMMTKARFANQDNDLKEAEYWEREVRSQLDEMKRLGIAA